MSNSRDLKTAHGESTPMKMVAKVIDGVTYQAEFEYFWQGEKCKIKELTSKQAKIIAAYGLIKKDLKYVEKSIEHAIEISQKISENQNLTKIYTKEEQFQIRDEFNFESDLLKSLYISSIVTYGKCFVQAQGRRVKLECKDVFSDNDNFEKQHLEIMEQRHQYIAHAGNTNHEHSKAVLIITPDNEPFFNAEAGHISGYGVDFFENFLSLSRLVHGYVNDTFQKKCDSFCKKEIEGKPIEELLIGAR